MSEGAKKGFQRRGKFEDPARLLAFDALTQIIREGAYANLRLPELLAESTLDERDRSWVTELVYGTLRMQGRHDHFLSLLIERPLESLDSGVLDLLRLGMHQIFEMRTADHAAVSASVSLARYLFGESPTSFVNGVLRNALRRRDEFAELDLPLYIRFSHPEWIVNAYRAALKDEDRLISLLEANNAPVHPHLVAWPGKSTVEELLELGGEAIPETSYGVYSARPPFTYPAIQERRAGVQDLGSQIIGEIFLNTAQGSKHLSWLDMCAGPGGKAAFLYNSLATDRPDDEFLANEPSEHRADLVSRVVPADLVHVGMGQEFATSGKQFDRIIVDAPCSGLGALRRRPEARWRKSPAGVKELVVLQRELLDAAVQALSADGILAYVTCSPHNAETRAQVADFLYRHKEWELIDATAYLPSNISDFKVMQPDGAIQMWTDLHGSDAMFMALLGRKNRKVTA